MELIDYKKVQNFKLKNVKRERKIFGGYWKKDFGAVKRETYVELMRAVINVLKVILHVFDIVAWKIVFRRKIS